MTQPAVPPSIEYESRPVRAGIPRRVQVMVTLNYVSAVIDLLGCVGGIGAAVFSLFKSPHSDKWHLIFALGVAAAIFSLAASFTKFIGASRILRRSPRSLNWGMALGILGCLQLWMFYLYVFTLGIGIYSVVICSLASMRPYFAGHEKSAGT
jgi:hypothetical protein